MKKQVNFLTVLLLIAVSSVFGTPNPNAFVDSLATHQNVTLTDSTIVLYGRAGINADPNLTDNRMRVFARSEDGNHISDTLWIMGSTVPVNLLIGGLSENETNNYQLVCQYVDTANGANNIISETTTYYLQGTTMWMHDQPTITSVVVTPSQTSLSFEVSGDGHAGAWYRPKFYNVANGPQTVAWANDSVFIQGVGTGTVEISGLLPGNDYWVQFEANDWLIGEGTAYPPSTYTTDMPEPAEGTMTVADANPDSVQICVDLVSNDNGGSYQLVDPLTNVVASGTFGSDTSFCVWDWVGTPQYVGQYTLTIQNTLPDPVIVTIDAETSALWNPLVEILAITNTGWYTATIDVAVTTYGSQGGEVYVQVGPNNVYGPYTVPPGYSVISVNVADLDANSEYLVEATVVQSADGQQEAVSQVYETTIVGGPSGSYGYDSFGSTFTFCLNDVMTNDPDGAEVHLVIGTSNNVLTLLDTVFEWSSGPVCVSIPTSEGVQYSWDLNISDTIGQYSADGSFFGDMAGASPVMNMGNGLPDPNSSYAAVSFWMNPDPTDANATGDARLKVGTSPGLIITPVDNQYVPETGNYSFEFDYSPFQEVGQTVTLWFTMDGTNSNGGYGQFQANNFMTLPALPDTVPPPVVLEGETILYLDTAYVDSTSAGISFQGTPGDSTNTMWRINYSYNAQSFSTLPVLLPQGWTSQLANLAPLPPSTQVWWQLELSNGYGVYYQSAYMSFTTDAGPTALPPDPPTPLVGPEILSNDTLDVGETYATLIADVNPNDSTGLEVDFIYIIQGQQYVTISQAVTIAGDYTQGVSGLPSGTLVQYRSRLTYQGQVLVQGPWRSFVTDQPVVIPPVLVGPEVFLSDTLSVGTNSATLVFDATNGDSTGVYIKAEYNQGGSSQYSSAQSVSSQNLFNLQILNLQPGEITNYRAVLFDNTGDLVYGPWLSFVTDTEPVIPPVLEGPDMLNQDTVSVDSTTAVCEFYLTNGDSSNVSYILEVVNNGPAVFTSPQSVSGEGWYFNNLSNLITDSDVSVRVIMSDLSGTLYTGPWLTFHTDAGPIVVPVDEVLVTNYTEQVVMHNAFSVSWDIDPLNTENVEARAKYGLLSPNQTADQQDVNLSDTYFFAVQDAIPNSIYKVKLEVLVDGVVFWTSPVYEVHTPEDPSVLNSIEDIRAGILNPDGQVYDLSGKLLTEDLVSWKAANQVGNPNWKPNQMLFWRGKVNDHFVSIKFLSK